MRRMSGVKHQKKTDQVISQGRQLRQVIGTRAHEEERATISIQSTQLSQKRLSTKTIKDKNQVPKCRRTVQTRRGNQEGRGWRTLS